AVALDEENLRAVGAGAAAIGELAGQAQLARRRLALELALLAAPRAVLGALDHRIEQEARARRVIAQPMIEPVLERAFDEPCRLGRGEALLGLTLELRIAYEEREDHRRAFHHVFGGDLLAAPFAGEPAISFEAARQGGAQPRLMGSAFRRRHRVAERRGRAFVIDRPGNRPFDPPAAIEIGLAVECARRERLAAIERRL